MIQDTFTAEKKVAPYGSWKSPITADMIVSGGVTLEQVEVDGPDVYWSEIRPMEDGRSVIVCRQASGRRIDMTPKDYNARSRMHEYGGGAFVVSDGCVYFVNFNDQRVYSQTIGSKPRQITIPAKVRYADAVVDRDRNRLICAREDHTFSDQEPTNTLVSINLPAPDHPDEVIDAHVLISGNDFYSSPALCPDGSRLAWLTWNRPNMPWDGSELWIGEIGREGSVARARCIAGGSGESIFQPQWSPDGSLYFVSDRSGWWNLYRWRDGQVEHVLPMEAEFGAPQWRFKLSTYAVVSADQIVCTFAHLGTWRLGLLNTTNGELESIQTPYTEIGSVRSAPGGAVFKAGSPTEPTSVVFLNVKERRLEVLYRTGQVPVNSGYLSVPEPIQFPTEGDRLAHGLFYPPTNRDYDAPPGELPPLLVRTHGGPNRAATTDLDLQIQYWTSRGFAFLDVNYGGSTGYGREYLRRLYGQWGVVDVDDSVNGARYLSKQGIVDKNRMAMRGDSAGGLSTLSALLFRDVFKAGASYWGVMDMSALAEDTHKFESRYLDQLVGPYPEKRDLYVQRSPIYHATRLSRPVIFFQGLDDKIVLPSQAERMVEVLRVKGVPVAYIPFEGEQHGFRRSESIKRSIEAELYFYSRVFGFDLPEPVEPIIIYNLDDV